MYVYVLHAHQDAFLPAGGLEDTLAVGGVLHFAFDIEQTIESSHACIAAGGAVAVLLDHALTAVVECASLADALKAASLVASNVLNTHHVLLDVIVFIEPGLIPYTSCGDKHRFRVRDALAAGILRPRLALAQA
jgi:hypothetical protein